MICCIFVPKKSAKTPLANSYFYLVRINSYNLRSEKMEWKEFLP